ncbi:spermine oxidase-like isoform X2 [Pectinophora gossypiella]|uniref:spermine oxidase-like isoform X2 n=1 Tax=Pectinophora gossypiella TaxID=13191 RepID=UPI00214E6419|nr:spermine oxidase-like isoform X2 [Pectinophora gossypiella]
MSQLMDAIVIGCGASGVAALRRLHEAGMKVLGLEAADRIGGRICTVEFGDAAVDIGAAWCHGEKDNAVFELANPLGLLGKPGPVEFVYILSNGEVIKDGGKITDVLDKVIANAEKNNAKSISETLRSAAKTNDTLTKDPQLTNSIIEWFERNNHVGGQTDPRKGKSLRGLAEFWNSEGEFWLHWKGRGYKTILDVLLNKYPDPSKEIPIQILLNKKVESIKWGTTSEEQTNPLVQVKCKDGSLFAARSVIVTVSVGVLKERHAQLFNPPLPAEKVTTINTLQFCVLDKIYIEFEQPWWKNAISFSILWREEDKARFPENEKWITEIYGFQTVDWQKNVLLAWIYGYGAEQMEKVSLEGVKAGVKKLMDSALKNYNVTPVKNIIRSQWASNPLARGAYAYRSVATEQDGGSAVILSKPLYHGDIPVVCFAGEATSHHRHTAVHGAVEAGFREADRIIECFKRK